MYEFSLPMPYSKEATDKLISINNEVEKSKITSLYFSLPASCELFTGFEQFRNEFIGYNNFNFWKELIAYSIEKNFDFIYLLNRPNSNRNNEQNLNVQLDKLDKLLKELNKIGVKKLRVSDHKLLTYLNREYQEFILYSSTSFEYKMLGEYKNFLKIHPYIKEIVPSHDINKNFKLLKNLISYYPEIDIELMVNQGCIRNCPFRSSHQASNKDKLNEKNIFSNWYYLKRCISEDIDNILIKLIKTNVIFPWEIQEYSKIGINKFKFTGRDKFPIETEKLISSYRQYLRGIDNVKHIENYPINFFVEKLQNSKRIDLLKIKYIKKYLPSIKYFVKYGDLCSSICGSQCRYCYNCAEKIEQILKVYEEKERKKSIPMCTINRKLAGV